MPTLVGWLVGILTFIALGPLASQATCGDGWGSPSIGRRGACSHHGGVSGPFFMPMLIFVGSIAVGGTARVLTAIVQNICRNPAEKRRNAVVCAGIDAREQGKFLTDNPYDVSEPEHELWAHGWVLGGIDVKEIEDAFGNPRDQ